MKPRIHFLSVLFTQNMTLMAFPLELVDIILYENFYYPTKYSTNDKEFAIVGRLNKYHRNKAQIIQANHFLHNPFDYTHHIELYTDYCGIFQNPKVTIPDFTQYFQKILQTLEKCDFKRYHINENFKFVCEIFRKLGKEFIWDVPVRLGEKYVISITTLLRVNNVEFIKGSILDITDFTKGRYYSNGEHDWDMIHLLPTKPDESSNSEFEKVEEIEKDSGIYLVLYCGFLHYLNLETSIFVEI